MSLVSALANSNSGLCGLNDDENRICDVQVIRLTKDSLNRVPRSSLELYSPFSFSNATHSYVVVVKMRVSKNDWNDILKKYQDISYVTSTKPKKECVQIANAVLRQLILDAESIGTFQVFRLILYIDCDDILKPTCLFGKLRNTMCWRHKRYRDSLPFARSVRRELGSCGRDASVFIDYSLESIITMHGKEIANHLMI